MGISRTHLFSGIALLFAGLLMGYVLFGGSSPQEPAPDDHADHNAEAVDDNGNGEVWTCSMHPSVRADGPGQCPICGMDLIPAGEMEETGDFQLVMSESAVELARIQTTEVTRDTPTREIRLPGRVEVDERRTTAVTSHVYGRIRDLMVDYTGARIEHGQIIATIYSPDVISAQRELLEAVRHRERSPEMLESARRKMRLWEFSEEEIRRIEEAGEVQEEVNIVSHVSGHVLSRNVSREEHVAEGAVLFEVADLNALWVVFDAYEEDLQWLNMGDTVEFTLRGQPGVTHEAHISYIDPVVDPQKRTVRVRADVSNNDGRLKPEMLVRGTVHGNGGPDQLMVPASSVLWTGPRSIVYVKDTGADVPHFESREVTLGLRAGDYFVIEDGLEEGEQVVTHGAFKIDSEFQLADRFSMMNRQPGMGVRPAHDHGDYEEGELPAVPDDHSLHVEDDFSSEAPEAFRAQLTEVVHTYLTVRDALLDSDMGAAQQQLGAMADALEEVDMTLLEGDAHDAWMQDLHALETHLGHVDHASTIEELRAEFQTVSQVLAYSIKQFGVEGVIYRQYCPMAFDDEGGYWLSDREEIDNPYLPEDMPRCGEVIERIE